MFHHARILSKQKYLPTWVIHCELRQGASYIQAI